MLLSSKTNLSLVYVHILKADLQDSIGFALQHHARPKTTEL